jgi:hypothetical protein
VGNGNIDVGSETPTRTPGQPMVDNLSGNNDSSGLRIDSSLKTERQEKSSNSSVNPSINPLGVCGAMSQQGSEFRGNVSAPQEFVRLVGCRDRKAGMGASQYSNPVKR